MFNENNAVYLGYGYSHLSRYSTGCIVGQPNSCLTYDIAYRSASTLKLKIWFPNTGNLGTDGLITSSSNPTAAKSFLNAVAAYESATGNHLTIMAVLNGASSGTTAVDLTNTAVRQSIVGESMKLVSASIAGSYISGATRSFDGVIYDIEPIGKIGGSDAYFNGAVSLMDETRAAFTGSPQTAQKKIAIYGQVLSTNTSNVWNWSSSYYYTMASHVDYLAAMTYVSGISSSGDNFAAWVTNQVQSILAAVSGTSFNDNLHPPPTNGVKVIIGFPAMPDHPTTHYRSVETIQYAAQGTWLALNNNKGTTSGDIANQFFLGAMPYAHTDGQLDTSTGTPNLSLSYATYAYDWLWWTQFWLKTNTGP